MQLILRRSVNVCAEGDAGWRGASPSAVGARVYVKADLNQDGRIERELDTETWIQNRCLAGTPRPARGDSESDLPADTGHGEHLLRTVRAGNGGWNQGDLTLHFGLNTVPSIAEVLVVWPNPPSDPSNATPRYHLFRDLPIPANGLLDLLVKEDEHPRLRVLSGSLQECEWNGGGGSWSPPCQPGSGELTWGSYFVGDFAQTSLSAPSTQCRRPDGQGGFVTAPAVFYIQNDAGAEYLTSPVLTVTLDTGHDAFGARTSAAQPFRRVVTFALGKRDMIEVEVQFAPRAEGRTCAVAVITSNDPDKPEWDGIYLTGEGVRDTDGDGLLDYADDRALNDPDADNDGLDDALEGGDDPSAGSRFRTPDSDGNGLSDALESIGNAETGGIAERVVNINFQPARDAEFRLILPPSDYLPDTGAKCDRLTSGCLYGWDTEMVSQAGCAEMITDVLADTWIEAPDGDAFARWRLRLPDGKYRLRAIISAALDAPPAADAPLLQYQKAVYHETDGTCVYSTETLALQRDYYQMGPRSILTTVYAAAGSCEATYLLLELNLAPHCRIHSLQLTPIVTQAVNFQPRVDYLLGADDEPMERRVAVPAGFTADWGLAYNDARGYGWVDEADEPTSIGDLSRLIHTNVTPSNQIFDTYVAGHNVVFSDDPVRRWRLRLAEGTYRILAVVGDLQTERGPHEVVVWQKTTDETGECAGQAIPYHAFDGNASSSANYTGSVQPPGEPFTRTAQAEREVDPGNSHALLLYRLHVYDCSDGKEDDGMGAITVTIGPDTTLNAILVLDETLDSDGDGLTDAREMALGTDPYKADTDDDGLIDSLEVFNIHFGMEPGKLNPLDSDSDDDGVPDGLDGLRDSDGDGIIDALDTDSDNDGILDGVEAGYYYNAGVSEDRNIVLDGERDYPAGAPRYAILGTNVNVFTGLAGMPVENGLYGDQDRGATTTNPRKRDTDGDFAPDADYHFGGSVFIGEDRNKNGLVDEGETDPNDPDDPGFDNLGAYLDSDGDGLPDYAEDKNGDGLFQPMGEDGIFGTDDDETDWQDADSDDDGISDGEEIRKYRTHPILPDSDLDGLPDGLEVGKTAHVMGKTSGQQTDHTFDGTNMYYGSRNPAPASKPTFTYFHPDHLFDNEYVIDAARACFIADQSPISTTDPTWIDTNHDGITDGISDLNANGRADTGEIDPAFGFRRGNLDSVWEQMDTRWVLPSGDPLNPSGLGTIQLSVSVGDTAGSSQRVRLISNPSGAALFDPPEIDATQFASGELALVTVWLLQPQAAVQAIVQNGDSRAEEILVTASSREATIRLVREIEKQIEMEIGNSLLIGPTFENYQSANDIWRKIQGAAYLTGISSYSLSESDKAMLWFLNHGSLIVPAFDAMHRKRLILVKNGFENGNTLNPPKLGFTRGGIFSECLAMLADEYGKKLNGLSPNTRIMGLSTIAFEKELRESIEASLEKRSEQYVTQSEMLNNPNSPGYYIYALMLSKSYIGRLLFLNIAWDSFVSPWTWDAFPKTLEVVAISRPELRNHFRLPGGYSQLRVGQHGKSMPLFPTEHYTDFDFYRDYTGNAWLGTAQDIYEAPDSNNTLAAWDLTRNHFSMDGDYKGMLCGLGNDNKVFTKVAKWYTFPNYFSVRYYGLVDDQGFPIMGEDNGWISPYWKPHRTGWRVDHLADNIGVGDDDGRIDHFLNHAVLLLYPIEVLLGEDNCCSCCRPGVPNLGPENSLRDLVQNRLGVLFGWKIANGSLDLSHNAIRDWTSFNLLDSRETE